MFVMTVAHARLPARWSARRTAFGVAVVLGVAGVAVLLTTALAGARFELVVAGLGLLALAAVVALLGVAAPGVSVVNDAPPTASS
jgi:hypothetical protein